MKETENEKAERRIKAMILSVMAWLPSQDFSATDPSLIRKAIVNKIVSLSPVSMDVLEQIEAANRVFVCMHWARS